MLVAQKHSRSFATRRNKVCMIMQTPTKCYLLAILRVLVASLGPRRRDGVISSQKADRSKSMDSWNSDVSLTTLLTRMRHSMICIIDSV